MEKLSSIPQPPTTKHASTSGYQRTTASISSMAENTHNPPKIKSRGRTRLPKVATVSAPKSAPAPLALSSMPYRGKAPEFQTDSEKLLKEKFPKLKYADVPGLCKAATRKEIEAQGWSLNPGRYVGVAAGVEVSNADFMEQFEALTEEFETLNVEARMLEERITSNAAKLLEA